MGAVLLITHKKILVVKQVQLESFWGFFGVVGQNEKIRENLLAPVNLNGNYSG